MEVVRERWAWCFPAALRAAACLLLATAAGAEDSIYWAAAKDTPNSIPGSIGRADLDGDGGESLIAGPSTADIPLGVAIDVVAGRLYWGITTAADLIPSIYSANLDGTDVQLFLSSATAPAGVVLTNVTDLLVDQSTRRLYWTNGGAPGARAICFVSLDDPTNAAAAGTLATGSAMVGTPFGLAIDPEDARVYWTSWLPPSLISFAPLPGEAGTSGTFAVTGASANQTRGPAIDRSTDPPRLFWANGSGDTAAVRLKVATLHPAGSEDETDVTGAAFDISPNPGGSLRSPAIDPDGDRIYWANATADTLSYATLSTGGGGADLPTGTANTDSLDGIALLKAPKGLAGPTITGTPEVGETLTCTAATWAPDLLTGSLYRAPATTGVYWTRDDQPIAGATNAAYTPTQPGEHRCARTAANYAGETEQPSNAVTVPDPFEDGFSDGFESGDTDAWSATSPP